MPSITTDQLTMAYADSGAQDGRPVLLIHGRPDDASAWDAVLPQFHAAGLRTIVPTLRGFGDTRLADALMAGDDKIVPTLKNKVMGAIADALPDKVAAQVHRGMSEPGSAG